MTLVVFTSSSEMVCTSDRFARKADGKAVGLETVTTVLEDVSAHVWSACYGLIWSAPISPTLAICAADSAGQDDILFASTAVEQISTVCAEDERANCGHLEVVLAVLVV